MRTGLLAQWLLPLVAIATPASANMLTPMTYQQKLDRSDVVVIGVVTAVTGPRPDRFESTATVTPIALLRGEQDGELVVLTSSRISEADPRCCRIGATYLMFLHRVPDSPVLASVNGQYGMIQIGATPEEGTAQVIPARE